MKSLLCTLLLLTFAACSHAANPSFSSFHPNHFTTNGLVIKANLNPSQFDTNASTVTITITNVSGISGGSLWTNILGVIQLLGGQTTNALLFVSGSANAATNTALTVDTVNVWTDQASKLLDFRHVGTNVASITPYGSFESGRNFGSWWTPSRDDGVVVIHDSASGESTYTTLYGAAVDDTDSSASYSYFESTLNTGSSPAAVLNLASVETSLVGSFNVLLQPDQGVARIGLVNQGLSTFKVIDNGSLYLLADSYSYWGDSDYSIVSIRDLTVDSARPGNGIAVWAVNGSRNGAIDGQTTTNTANLSVGVANGSSGSGTQSVVTESDVYFEGHYGVSNPTMFRFHPTVADLTANSAYVFDTATNKASADLVRVKNNGTNMVTVGPSGAIGFGPHANGAATNVLFRSGNNLVYTNGNAAPSIEVRNGSGELGYFGVDSGGNVEVESSAANRAVTLRSGLKTVNFNGNSLLVYPGSDDEISIGGPTSSSWFKDIGLKGIIYATGSDDGSGNYSRLELEHDNSNIVFDSTALGTGTARNFVFQSNGTSVASLRLDSKLYLTVAGGDATFSVGPSGSPIVSSSVANAPVYLLSGNNAAGLMVAQSSIQPVTETISIGFSSSNGAWVDQYFKGTLRQQGVNDGAGNTTSLELTHTGNAGNIEYKSAAAGTQTFRPHVFMVGSTNVAKFDTTSAATETRFWIYDEDNGTMERVSVGAPDSGGLGFKVLRIAN